jgi:hypothetical protein
VTALVADVCEFEIVVERHRRLANRSDEEQAGSNESKGRAPFYPAKHPVFVEGSCCHNLKFIPWGFLPQLRPR